MKSKNIIMAVIFVASFWGGSELLKQYNQSQLTESNANLNKSLPSSLLKDKVPDFALPDLDGVKHSIREWDGDVIVLNFWATWCPPCQRETPMFIELQEQYGNQGLQFVGVAIDTKDKVTDFVDTFGVNYPMLIGATDAAKISENYGNRLGGLPYTVVIDRTGHINYVQQGELKRDVAEKNIKMLL